jgi:cytochrome c-type biogenesis protein CcmH
VKSRWAWVALGLVVLVTLGIVAVRSQPDDSPDARASRLNHRLACPECAGESIADSNVVAARAIRERIKERIAAGKSDQEIVDELVLVYGDKVLRTPANEGIGLLAWLIPITVILFGLAGLLVAFRRWSTTPRRVATPEDEAIVAAARDEEA